MHEADVNKWLKSVERLPADMPIYPSPPDPRDHHEPLLAAPKLPRNVELPLHRILNQRQTPFCGGASAAGATGGFYKKHFSMTYLYWLSKQYDGIPDRPGTYLRTVCKVMRKYGCAPEKEMPFSTHPPAEITGLGAAKQYRLRSYYRAITLHDMKTALFRGHYILIATFITTKNWGFDSGGWIGKPAGDFRGGHATFLYGYDDDLQNDFTGYFLGVNSWGDRWGARGKFYLPYDYLDMTLNGRSKFIEGWSLDFEPIRTNPWLDYRDLHIAKKRLWG